MSFPKLLAIFAVLLFGIISLIAVFKQGKSKPAIKPVQYTKPIEVELEQDVRVVIPQKKKNSAAKAIPNETKKAKTLQTQSSVTSPKVQQPIIASAQSPQGDGGEKNLPDANRIEELFSVNGPKLPIVETITYKSRVAWQKGRPAWLSDYARNYQTSRHFIARSLNGKADYFKQDLVENARFNVFKKDKNIQFYLLVDLSRCKMWFYYDDLDTEDRVLLKTYTVGVGRLDGSKASGFLTPLGKYTLGNKVAIYKPKMMGMYNGEQTEMVTVFGSRWIPFDKEVQQCTAPAKGLGIHGLPWTISSSGETSQDRSSLGKYQSDGCVRLASEDIEEIFAIIITKPTIIELVKDFHDTKH